jgi:diaminohydroxyphosphoribosylaminopyrimidine deaminase/5-amino-6-(5-phosphoribosylamino)uracil reductase
VRAIPKPRASGKGGHNAQDRRLMEAAIRLSRWHLGMTETNPSVATLIVRESRAGPRIVGRGITAIGGRPHAEAQALAEAGKMAEGATAYVTLEPCAHHGRTPPCAEALVTAGIKRVVGAASDPDPRVSGKGYAILRKAGIEVVENVLVDQAREVMAGYLCRTSIGRPFVTLKIAVSSDGKIGRRGAGQVAITGGTARAQVHVMRAEQDAILVGIGTVLEDDPELTCRLDSMSDRSPVRIVLDTHGRIPPDSSLVKSAMRHPLLIAAGPDFPDERKRELLAHGVGFLGAEIHEERIALPELLDDLAARGIQSLMVEGGAEIAKSFLNDGLVDRITLFTGPGRLGEGAVASPVTAATVSAGFALTREAVFGEDLFTEWTRNG